MQIERINLLRANVPREQRHIAQSQPGPRRAAELPREEPDFPEINQLVQLHVADPQPIVARLFIEASVEINRRAVV